MYGLALYESQVKEDDFDYLDVAHCQLINAWFGLSKFWSTSALREAIRWKRASEAVFCHLRYIIWGSDGLVRDRRGGTGVARIFLGGPPGQTPPSLASVVHTFEAVAGSRGSVSAPAVSIVMGGAPGRNKNSKKYRWSDIWGRVFVNVVSLRCIGMIYINVG